MFEITDVCFYLFVFVRLGFFTHIETPSLSVKGSNFDLCWTLMAIEQWGFFSVPHLLWHGASVYNGHLRGPVTLTPIAERLAVELSLPVLQLRSVAANICIVFLNNTTRKGNQMNDFSDSKNEKPFKIVLNVLWIELTETKRAIVRTATVFILMICDTDIVVPYLIIIVSSRELRKAIWRVAINKTIRKFVVCAVNKHCYF